MNLISPKLVRGTVGELIVQLRLLQFDVQAAPPIKDSGNDLIAIRYRTFKAIQVKTTAGKTYPASGLPDFYHLLAVVHLVGEGSRLLLDSSRVFLIPKERVPEASRRVDRLEDFALCQEHIDEIFGPRHISPCEPVA